LIAEISSSLEEKEREEFSRLKVIKRKEQNNG
jgi:vacuolar-type H+-ATPase subunit D/Vma8